MRSTSQSSPTDSPASDSHREKSWVAMTSVLAAVFLTALKLIVGLSTGSLGIFSEAAHSALDLVAAGITFWAVRVADQPADREHTYGHGKFENLSAFVETLLLLTTCVWIAYEAIHRLLFDSQQAQVTGWAVAVMVVSIVVDIGRSRALKKAAKKYQSQALEADALHFSTDIWSSSVVLVGLACVWMAERYELPWLHKADPIAALGVAIIVVSVSLRLGKKSLADLLDSVPPDLPQSVRLAANVTGVLDVANVRVRRSGKEVFVDVVLTVARSKSLEQAHDIATAAETAVRAMLGAADIVVHVEPVAEGREGIVTAVRLVSARHGFGAHGILVYPYLQGFRIELHLEVPDSWSIGEAARRVDVWEQALRGDVPQALEVVAHLDPVGDSTSLQEWTPADDRWLREELENLRLCMSRPFALLDLRVMNVGDRLAASVRCGLDQGLSLAGGHEFAVSLEDELRRRNPLLSRVVVQVVPWPIGSAEVPT